MSNRDDIPAAHKVKIRSYGPLVSDCIIELDGKTLGGCLSFQFEMNAEGSYLQTVTLKLVVNEIEIVSVDPETHEQTT